MTARGAMTISKLCGEKWGRLLPVSLAAAYCGMQVRDFLKSRFAAFICFYDGTERVDRDALDREIDRMTRESLRANADAIIAKEAAR